jgi:MFS family permease
LETDGPAQAREPAPARDSFAALRLPAVRGFAVGRIASVFGAQMLDVAVGWQLYERTGSAFSLGLVGLVQVVPVVLLALPAGAAADRFDRRWQTMLAQTGMALCALGLGLISWLHGPTWAIYALLFGTGLSGTFARPASSSLLAQIVPPEHFVNANAWLSSGFQLGATAGPALAGVMIALTGGATAVFMIDAAAALLFVFALATMPRSVREAQAARAERNRLERAELALPLAGATGDAGVAGGPGAVAATRAPQRSASDQSLGAGLRFVFKTPMLLAPITLDLFAVLLGGATALLPIYAKDILHVGPTGLGALRAASSVGAFTAAILQTRIGRFEHTGRVLLGCVTVYGLATIGFGLSRWFPLSLLCLALLGGFDNVSAVIRSTLEQVVSPDALRGRVAAIHWVFIGLSNEMGDFESGLAAWLVGPVIAVVGGGIGTLVVVLVVSRLWPEVARLGHIEDAKAAA